MASGDESGGAVEVAVGELAVCVAVFWSTDVCIAGGERVSVPRGTKIAGGAVVLSRETASPVARFARSWARFLDAEPIIVKPKIRVLKQMTEMGRNRKTEIRDSSLKQIYVNADSAQMNRTQR